MRHNNESNHPFYVRPLIGVFEKLILRIGSETQSQVIVTPHTWREFESMNLPPHIQINKRPALGKRVAVHGSARSVLAEWPNDSMEATIQASLVTVVKEWADLRIGDYDLHCRAGDILLIPQGVPRSYQSHLPPAATHSSCDLMWVRPHINDQQLNVWICHSTQNSHDSGPQFGSAQIKNAGLSGIFETLSNELQQNPQGALSHHLLLSCILLIHRELTQGHPFIPHHHEHELKDFSEQPSTSHSMEYACRYIAEHLDQSLTINQLARMSCLSSTTFVKQFRNHAGKNFHEYLTEKRLEHADALLKDTDLPVNAIATKVGLHYSQLRRLYFKMHGCSPGSFRRKCLFDKYDNTLL